MWAIGTKFEVKTSTSFEELGSVTSIHIPGITTDTQVATTLSTTDNEDGFEQIVATVHRSDEGSVTVLHSCSNTVLDSLKTSQISRTAVECQITFPENSAADVEFTAIITGIEFDEITPEGLIKTTVKFKPTGAVTL